MKTKFCLICIFLLGTFLTKAQLSKDYLATALGKEGQQLFQEASILYERILFLNDDESAIVNAIEGKVRCLKSTGQFKAAMQCIQANISNISSDSLQYKFYEELVLCSYLANELEACVTKIDQLKWQYPKHGNIVWLDFLKILSLNEQQKWTDAALLYKEWLKNQQLDSLSVAIYNHIPKLKSENKASWLSTFIPGGGQLYAGKPWEALASVALHGIGLYYGYTNFIDKHYLSAWLVGGGIFGSFHFGGVRRSEELIKQYNKKTASLYNEQLKKQLTEQLQLAWRK